MVMNTTYAQQIKCIQHARKIVAESNENEILKLNIDYGLNDAGSTIASLNLTKDLKSEREAQLEKVLKEIISERDKSNKTEDLFEVLQAIEKAKSLLKLNT
jgi:basic membrane lipoprotein Med (substrate-binding protein (PBP1-ABC) superfamily)